MLVINILWALACTVHLQSVRPWYIRPIRFEIRTKTNDSQVPNLYYRWPQNVSHYQIIKNICEIVLKSAN